MADIIYTFSRAFFENSLQKEEEKQKTGKKEETNRVIRKKERKTFVLHHYLTLAFSLAMPKGRVNPNSFTDLTDHNIFSTAKYFITKPAISNQSPVATHMKFTNSYYYCTLGINTSR